MLSEIDPLTSPEEHPNGTSALLVVAEHEYNHSAQRTQESHASPDRDNDSTGSQWYNNKVNNVSRKDRTIESKVATSVKMTGNSAGGSANASGMLQKESRAVSYTSVSSLSGMNVDNMHVHSKDTSQSRHIDSSNKGFATTNTTDMHHFPSPSNPTKQQRSRTSFSPAQLQVLNAELEMNDQPSAEKRLELQLKLKLPEKTIRYWFQNKRQKKRDELKREQNESDVHSKKAGNSKYVEMSVSANNTRNTHDSHKTRASPPVSNMEEATGRGRSPSYQRPSSAQDRPSTHSGLHGSMDASNIASNQGIQYPQYSRRQTGVPSSPLSYHPYKSMRRSASSDSQNFDVCAAALAELQHVLPGHFRCETPEAAMESAATYIKSLQRDTIAPHFNDSHYMGAGNKHNERYNNRIPPRYGNRPPYEGPNHYPGYPPSHASMSMYEPPHPYAHTRPHSSMSMHSDQVRTRRNSERQYPLPYSSERSQGRSPQPHPRHSYTQDSSRDYGPPPGAFSRSRTNEEMEVDPVHNYKAMQYNNSNNTNASGTQITHESMASRDTVEARESRAHERDTREIELRRTTHAQGRNGNEDTDVSHDEGERAVKW